MNPNTQAHPVQIGIRILRHVIVEDYIDSFYVHPTAKQISGYEDPALKILKLLVPREPEKNKRVTPIEL